MARKTSSAAAAIAVAAAFSMSATSLAAAELPAAAGYAPVKVYDGDAENAANHRWRGRRDGIDTGDVVAGVLVIGAIAAIASAASKNNRESVERYPSRYPYPQEGRYPRDGRYPDNGRYQQPNPRDRYEGSGMDRAVDMCVNEIEIGRERVDSVDGARRGSDGWHVEGELRSGQSFTCYIDNNGRMSDLRIGGDSAAYEAPAGDRQWGDDAYSRARGDIGEDDARRPAYPGGPYEGEDVGADDGRYSLSQAPDFNQN